MLYLAFWCWVFPRMLTAESLALILRDVYADLDADAMGFKASESPLYRMAAGNQ